MGAWDIGSFDNDAALDWMGDLVDGGGLRLVRKTLKDAVAGAKAGDLDSDIGAPALAAAEAVAALAGRPAPDLPEELTAWLAGKPAPAEDLVALALAALDAVEHEGSELRMLWAESEHAAAWAADVAALRARLKGG